MLGLPLYLSLANTLQLPEEELCVALENRIFYPKVRADFMGGVRSGVNGTPTFHQRPAARRLLRLRASRRGRRRGVGAGRNGKLN
jgi:hypothetical protein